MSTFLTYDLKVAVLVAVFYMFYRLLLSRETFHRVNRVVLLTTAVASFVLPLMVITIHKTVVVSGSAGTIGLGGLSAVVEEAPTPLWQMLAVGLFFAGMTITLGHTLLSVLRVWLLIRRCERHPLADGTVVCVADRDLSPFSWMHFIVLSRNDYETGEVSILAHERGHISQRHSLDLLLVDTLTALQWFNPAMWMLRQDLRAIHEYEADAAVLSQGINMRQYQYLLIQKAVSRCGYSVANGISHSTLKNRINMMLNKKSNRRSMLKLLALLPIVGTVLALQAETVNDYVYSEPQKKIVKKGRKAGQIKVGANTIEVKTDSAVYTGENVMMNIDKDDVADGELIVIDTIDAKANPLIIIDGQRATVEQMDALDSKTIGHVTVLKDKAAIEQFGEGGKNGVIIITTKKEPVLFLGKAKVDSTGIQFKEAVMESPSEYEDVFDVVEKMPEFPGGVEGMMKFLTENVRYPEPAHKAGTEGRVLVQFIVETDGTVSNAKVVKKVSDDLDGEAIRVVGSMPKWKPGTQNDRPVRVKYTLPISFRLK
ncbi:MAG: TonB family protein [Prevotella sp.]|nr:TonB family protein [Prevotella sp.]